MIRTLKYCKIGIAILISMPFLACIDMKKITYFNNLSDGEINSSEEIVPMIHKNDILSISVSSLNPEASAVFNAPNLLPTSSSIVLGSPSQLVGYLVNEKGDIMFPVLGNVHAEGLTTMQLSNAIDKMLTDKKQLVDPIVSTRITNFRVTILGEVGHPGVIPVPNEQITILEALGFAGDLPLSRRRDNVLLIREAKGKKIVQHFD